MRLDELPHSRPGVVVGLDGGGVERRRLLDLGLVPGTEVTPLFTSPLGDPRAYLVRGATIALRRARAAAIQVRVREES